MTTSRKHNNAGRRKPNHDYRSRCIYHIVINKAEKIADFAKVKGDPESHEWQTICEYTPIGDIISEALSSIKQKFPHTSILRRCIMPDHLHIAIFIKKPNLYHLGDIIKYFKTQCTILWEEKGKHSDIHFFTPGYYDNILRGKGQLKRMLDYISDNPRRYLIRRQHPGWHHHFTVTDTHETYRAYGNWDLLAEADLNPVRISSKFTPEELIMRKKQWRDTVINDGVLVSPFISEKEKAVRDWALNNDGALIILTKEIFSDRYHPYGRYHDLCSEGRLLLISIPQEPGESSRSHCLRMNDIAERIAAGTFHNLLP